MADGDVQMTEIDSGDVMNMRDVSFSQLLDELNAKAAQTRMSAALMWTFLLLGIAVGFATGGPGLLLCVAAFPAWAIGKWLDSYRRSTVLYYDLEEDAEAAYRRLTDGFDGLASCAAHWHIESGGAVQSLTAWKRNAGASHLVNRRATTLAYKLPAVIKSNVTPPALHVGKQVVFFMPDIVLVQDGSRVGAVNYKDLNIRWQDSRFIESDRVPSDARVVGHTWQHPNKSGGPDRRFRNNRQIPICLYEAMHLTSSSGVNELVEFSKTGVVPAFVDGCRSLAALPREAKAPPKLLGTTVESAPAIPVRPSRRPRTAIAAVLAFIVSVPVIVGIIGDGGDNPTVETLPQSTANTPHSQPVEAQVPVTRDETVTQPIILQTTIYTTAPSVAGPDISNDAQRTLMRFTRTSVNLREGPGRGYAVIMVVPPQTAVSVIETNGPWSRVEVAPETTGWMANSTITER